MAAVETTGIDFFDPLLEAVPSTQPLPCSFLSAASGLLVWFGRDGRSSLSSWDFWLHLFWFWPLKDQHRVLKLILGEMT